MKHVERAVRHAFGMDEGFPALPVKISNVALSRLRAVARTGVCGYCFPHGIETDNSHVRNAQRSWKRHRDAQWRDR